MSTDDASGDSWEPTEARAVHAGQKVFYFRQKGQTRKLAVFHHPDTRQFAVNRFSLPQAKSVTLQVKGTGVSFGKGEGPTVVEATVRLEWKPEHQHFVGTASLEEEAILLAALIGRCLRILPEYE